MGLAVEVRLDTVQTWRLLWGSCVVFCVFLRTLMCFYGRLCVSIDAYVSMNSRKHPWLVFVYTNGCVSLCGGECVFTDQSKHNLATPIPNRLTTSTMPWSTHLSGSQRAEVKAVSLELQVLASVGRKMEALGSALTSQTVRQKPREVSVSGRGVVEAEAVEAAVAVVVSRVAAGADAVIFFKRTTTSKGSFIATFPTRDRLSRSGGLTSVFGARTGVLVHHYGCHHVTLAYVGVGELEVIGQKTSTGKK